MVLELGSIDLFDATTDEQTVALSIEAFVDRLHTEVNVKFIMCEIITRAKPLFEQYNKRVGNLNSELAKVLANTPFAKMRCNQGLSNSLVNINLQMAFT